MFKKTPNGSNKKVVSDSDFGIPTFKTYVNPNQAEYANKYVCLYELILAHYMLHLESKIRWKQKLTYLRF